MKTLEEIKEEFANQQGFKSWYALFTACGASALESRMDKIAKVYADQFRPKSIGVDLIATERQRQIKSEGYDIKQDFEFNANGELAGAAGCYIANAINKLDTSENLAARFQIFQRDEIDPQWKDAWPWAPEFDKRLRHHDLRSLVIAGALIAAEIERLQAAPERKEEGV